LIYIFCDGASRGNPGPAAIGVFACFDANDKKPFFQISKKIEVTTNNVAEWKALLVGLEEALKQSQRHVQVFMDSQLVVHQVNGIYKVKNPKLIPLYKKFLSLKSQFESFAISHIPREQNKQADLLANQALDK